MRIEANIQAIRWIMQLKMQFTQRNHNTSLWTDCFIWLHKTTVSLSPRLLQLLSYDIRNEQICRTISISSRLVTLHFIGDKNFKSEIELCIQCIEAKRRLNFGVESLTNQISSWGNKHGLGHNNKHDSMTSIYISKICIQYRKYEENCNPYP